MEKKMKIKEKQKYTKTNHKYINKRIYKMLRRCESNKPKPEPK